MTRADIIRMALDTGFDADDETTLTSLERFASLVAAAEREACAALVQANAEACDTYSTARRVLESNAAAIRARSTP